MKGSSDGGSTSDKSSQSGGKMSGQQAYEAGMARESWCAVECKKEQDWCRATRKHFNQQFKSTVFNASGPAKSSARRCTWKVETPTHRERRHYDDKYDNQLKL